MYLCTYLHVVILQFFSIRRKNDENNELIKLCLFMKTRIIWPIFKDRLKNSDFRVHTFIEHGF